MVTLLSPASINDEPPGLKAFFRCKVYQIYFRAFTRLGTDVGLLMHDVQPREHAAAVVVPHGIDDAAAGVPVIDKHGGASYKRI
jgi:hypothetical protein